MITSTKSALKKTQSTTVSSVALLTAPPSRSSHSARDSSSSQVVEGANGDMVIDDVRTPGRGSTPSHTGGDIAGEVTPASGKGGTAGQRVVPCTVPRRTRATWNPLPACQPRGTREAPNDDRDEPSRKPACSNTHAACPGRGGSRTLCGRRNARCSATDVRGAPCPTMGQLLGHDVRPPTWRIPPAT